jgi:hypothetical protein
MVRLERPARFIWGCAKVTCPIGNILLALTGLHCRRASSSPPRLSDVQRPANAPRMVGRFFGRPHDGSRPKAKASVKKKAANKGKWSATLPVQAAFCYWFPVAKPPTPLEQAALLRDEAARAHRMATGVSAQADRDRLNMFANELRARAAALERQAAAETRQRDAEPSRDTAEDEPKPKKGRGGSNDPEPQA